MSIAICYDSSNNSIKNYFFMKDGYYYYDEYSDEGYSIYRTKSLDDLYSLFSKKDSDVFVKKLGDFELYLDSFKHIHFIRDGKEDFKSFFTFNGKNAISYSSAKKMPDSIKKFIVGGMIVVGSLSLFDTFNTYVLNRDKLYPEKLYHASTSYSYADALQAVRGIDSLPEELTSKILRSGILKDVLPYYNRNQMGYFIDKEIKDISINYYDSTTSDVLDSAVMGFYSPFDANVINLRRINGDSSFGHEFVHLLQTPQNKFTFLDEPLAELMSHEYFGTKLRNNEEEVKLLKLLVSTVGVEPIFEASFSGDVSALSKIVKKNLDGDDAKRFIGYLSGNPCGKYEFVRLVEKMYFNINGVEMKDAVPGFGLLASDITTSNMVDGSYYFRTNLDGDGVSFEINEVDYDPSFDLRSLNINPNSIMDIYYYRKEINPTEYHNMAFDYSSPYKTSVKYDKDLKITVAVKNNIEMDSDEEVVTYTVNQNGRDVRISEEEAFNRGLIHYYAVAREGSIDPEDGWEFDHISKKVTGTMVSPTAEKTQPVFKVRGK